MVVRAIELPVASAQAGAAEITPTSVQAGANEPWVGPRLHFETIMRLTFRFFFLIPTLAIAAPKGLSPNEFKSQLELMEVYATHLESYNEDGMFKLSIEASELIYSAGHMQPPPKDDTAAMWCAIAAQSLRNYIDDRRKGATGSHSAKLDMADYKEQKPKCLRALKKG